MPHIAGETYETAIDPFATGIDWGQWVSPGAPFSVGQLYNRVDDPGRYVLPPEIFPTVRVGPQGQPEEGVSVAETPRVTNVPDPEYLPQGTVFEDAPGGIYETNRAPTDWDAVYEAYVELNQPKSGEIVIDWAKVGGEIIGGWLDPFGMGNATTQFLTGGSAPTTVTGVPALGNQPVRVDPATGRLVKCKRRRRRRLLTDGDFNDLMRISTLPNKDIVKIALAKAVGR